MAYLMPMANNGVSSEKLPALFSQSKTSATTLQSKQTPQYPQHAWLLILDDSVFVQEMRYVTDHILASAAADHRVVDFHDLMYKFTLDSFVL